MGWWRVGADTLAASRFVVSPLAETTATLMTLEQGPASYSGVRATLDEHQPAYRKRLADDPITGLALRAALGRRWVADFLTPAPLGESDGDGDSDSGSDGDSDGDGDRSFAGELALIRVAAPEAVFADLEVSLGGPLPAKLRRPDLAVRLAGLVEWVWTECVRPSWPRRRRILEADILARVARLGQGGWAAALDGMRPGIRWLGDSRLQINTQAHPPRDISSAQLLFVPVTPGRGWVSWSEPWRYALTYPCAGVLAEASRAPAPAALSALIGPGRARVLVLLDTPMSTTQLVALTGLGLGSVGRHLQILLESRLVQRRRAGRSVLYSRTYPGDALVHAPALSGKRRLPR